MAPTPLPIDALVPPLVESLRARPNAVVLAAPGAGKTTRIPPALVDAFEGRVLLLQPRRVAARAAAARIASERGWTLGREVGYQIRFENRTTPATRLCVLTEGILARRIQRDPFLEGVSCVLLDEFHERSLFTDLAVALLREVQQTVREDLRIVVLSATLDPARAVEFLGDAPVFDSPGRVFPVEIEHLEATDTRPVWEKTAAAVARLLAQPAAETGHILVFLPGLREIHRTRELLPPAADTDVHLMHSSIPAADQDRALAPCARRKVILATNIAETSLTFDGVRTVVDAGLAKVAVTDERLGIERLETRRISRASADQRAGRAGRTAPGRCLRLWTRREHASLDAAETPEIRRADLAATVLTLHDYGVRDPAAFGWFEAPRPEALARASELLWMLGAVGRDGVLTPTGRALAGLPVHPRLGRLLLEGARRGMVEEAATIAALLSEGASDGDDPRRPAPHEADSDIVELMERHKAGIHAKGRVEEARRQLRDLAVQALRGADGLGAG